MRLNDLPDIKEELKVLKIRMALFETWMDNELYNSERRANSEKGDYRHESSYKEGLEKALTLFNKAIYKL